MPAENLNFRNSRATLLLFILTSLISCHIGQPLRNVVSDSALVTSSYNFSSAPIHIPSQDPFRNDINNKKIVIILTFLGVSVLGAIILSFVNVHYDFLELRNFYRGYMGRRLLIQEGRLTYRKHPGTQETKADTDTDIDVSRRDKHRSQNGAILFSRFEEVSSPVTTTSLILPERQPESLMMRETRMMGAMPLERPPKCSRYIEDEGPEWRELDYIQEVGQPPTTFCEFFQQYDWNFYRASDSLTLQEIEERKNLLNQFRKWKKRKRKTFNIVVTERSRREMAEQEEEKNKKRIPPKQ